jgi:hypothetical protein
MIWPLSRGEGPDRRPAKPGPAGGRGHRAEQATLAQAKLNLSYSRSPPWSGSLAKNTAQVRDLLQPGRTLLSVLRGAKRDLHHCELQRDPACIYARGSIGQSSSRRVPRREAARRQTASMAGRVRASLCYRMRWEFHKDGLADSGENHPRRSAEWARAVSPGMSAEATMTLTALPGWRSFLSKVN